jgi:hypothetical protein
VVLLVGAAKATPGMTTVELFRIPTGVLAGIYFAQLPYNPSLTGAWTINASNGTDTAQSIRPGFVPVTAMPFVENISFTGTGNNITVNWTVPDPSRLDLQQVFIWDLSGPNPVTVSFFNIGTAARSVDLASLGLIAGRKYAVEINNADRNSSTNYIDAFSGTWLSGWTPTEGGAVNVPEPASIMLLIAGLAGVSLLRRRGRS